MKGIPAMNTAEDMGAQEKAAVLKKIRDQLHEAVSAAQVKTASAEKVLQETEAKQEKILGLLNDDVRRHVNEEARLNQELQTLSEKLDSTLEQKAEAEKKSEIALRDRTAVEEKLKTMLAEKAETESRAETCFREKAAAEEKLGKVHKEIETINAELGGARSTAETAVEEKTKMEKKLQALQENWENYVGGR